MADLNLQKVDLSSIKVIAHDGVTLNVLIERNGSESSGMVIAIAQEES